MVHEPMKILKIQMIVDWIIENNIECLNIFGNIEDLICNFLEAVFTKVTHPRIM